MPKRIQRKRAKGWRMPEGAVYVGRPTRWGNPFKIGSDTSNCQTAQQAVEAFEEWWLGRLRAGHLMAEIETRYLKGRDLVCWCPLDQPCHADVLLRIANAPKSP